MMPIADAAADGGSRGLAATDQRLPVLAGFLCRSNTCQADNRKKRVTQSRRPLSSDEARILREIQDFWGSQNGDPDVFIGDSGEAIIFVTATDGSTPVMVNLTNLGAWFRDGSLDVVTMREWVRGPLASTSQDRIVTVFMPLRDEGVVVWRPVDAEALPSGWYRIVSVNEQPDDESWAFPTDAIVVCELRHLADGECLVVSGERP